MQSSTLCFTPISGVRDLGFLCYDQRRHQAFLGKSGACPTYLIREDQIMEISGESLPIGIIQEIETDCFQIDCQDQDCFVMSSDGVEKQVLDQWIRGGDPDQILQRIETGLQAMEETGCADDVTVLIARVSKR
ncbi:MAG: SpoIIE family protein phosphatase [Merdibacter sp.]